MKIAATNNTVERSGVVAEGAFTIKASAKAFQILSSGLYSNKIRSIIREICSNAIDSHAAAATSELPIVHLPNSFEPWFSVQDFGVGLSHDQVMRLYTTYFDSNKTDSNDYIGALGLGSKSPFSYSPSFTVVSIHNGTKSIYTAFMSEEGLPNIALLSSEATTDKNGMTVTVPVKPGDNYYFEDEARHALRFFPVLPKVIGVSHFNVFKFDEPLLYKGEGYELYQRDPMGIRAYAIQGPIGYPISSFFESLNPEYKQKYSYLSQKCLVLHFNIGQLDVAASRESISYDKATTKVLLQRLESVHQDIVKQVEDKISSSSDYFEACNRGYVESNKLGNSHLISQWSYNGKALAHNINLYDPVEKDGVVLYGNFNKRHKPSKYTGLLNINVLPHSGVGFYLDTGKGHRKIVLDAQKHINAIVFRTSLKFAHVIMDKLGANHSRLVSSDTLQAPPRLGTTRWDMTTCYMPTTLANDDIQWNKIDKFDPSKGGWYVSMTNHKPTIHQSGIAKLLRVARLLSMKLPPIVGFKSQYLIKHPNPAWKSFLTEIVPLIVDTIMKSPIPELVAQQKHIGNYRNLFDVLVHCNVPNEPMVAQAADISKKWAARTMMSQTMETIISDCEVAGISIRRKLEMKEMPLNQALVAKYPLLRFFEHHDIIRHTKDVEAYLLSQEPKI